MAPSSTSIMTAAAVIGLVIEANRKIESLSIAGPPRLASPTAANSARPPMSPRATSPTAPGSDPLLTWASSTSRRSVIGPPLSCPVTRVDRQAGRDSSASRVSYSCGWCRSMAAEALMNGPGQRLARSAGWSAGIALAGVAGAQIGPAVTLLGVFRPELWPSLAGDARRGSAVAGRVRQERVASRPAERARRALALRPDQPPHGISATTRVPPPGAFSTRKLPRTAQTRSSSPRRPLPRLGSAPPTPLSATSTRSAPLCRDNPTLALEAWVYLATFRQRFGHDEIGGGLDGFR